jgi:hypothetical protein
METHQHLIEIENDKRFLKTLNVKPGNTKGGSITVPLTSCLAGLDKSVLQIKTKSVSHHTANSKPVKQEVNGTMILPPLVFPG